jgi:hypothetical protein
MFQIFNALIGNIPFGIPCEFAVIIPKNKGCTVGNGGRDIAAAVCIFALTGNENVTLFNLSAV